MRKISLSLCLLVALASFLVPAAHAQHSISTIAGGVPQNLPALQVGVGFPSAVFQDSLGNLYVAVTTTGTEGLFGNVVYRIDSSGKLTTVAGNGTEGYSGDGGPAASAALEDPNSIFVDAAGNLFIADSSNDRIREVVAATGIIETVAGNGQFGFSGDGGPATNAMLDHPDGVFVDGVGDIFIADSNNGRIREVVASTGIIRTVAGGGHGSDGGPATSAKLVLPQGVFVDGSGNIVIADAEDYRIRKVIAATGIIETVAGDGVEGTAGDGGPATSAELAAPAGLFVDRAGNILFADAFAERVREVVAATGIIQSVAGTGMQGTSGDGGPATAAELSEPADIWGDASGNIFIADYGSSRIREIVVATGDVQTVAGNGTFAFAGDGGLATNAILNAPTDVSADGAGNVFISDDFNFRIREVNSATGTIETAAGNGTEGFSGDGGPATASSMFPVGVFANEAGDIFVIDQLRIREVLASTGTIETIAGNGSANDSGDGGPATSAGISGPHSVSVDRFGNIFIADATGNCVREVTAATGIIQTVAGTGIAGYSGDGGVATSAELNFPMGVSVDSSGNIFIADSENNRIREVVAATGVIQTVAGNGSVGFSGDGGAAVSAELSSPQGVYVDAQDDVFIVDTYNSRIRGVDRTTGIIQTVGGDGNFGFGGDGGPAIDAELDLAGGNYNAVSSDHKGNLLLADEDNNRIRVISGIVPVVGVTVAPSQVTLNPGTTQQFSASVANAQNTSVTWSISGTGCTGSSCGMISQQGLYTAPASVSGSLTVMVTAAAVADGTKSAVSTVTVDPPSSTSGGTTQPVTGTTTKSTSTTLQSSMNPSVGGQLVSFTATVAVSASSTPTGTVTFLDGGTVIGSGVLNAGGVASLTTTALSKAAHSIIAQYSGDANFAGSTSAAVSETVAVAGFAPVAAQSVKAGQSLIVPLTLYAAPGSNLTFTLGCSGLPAQWSCAFSPNSVIPEPPPNGTIIQMTLMTTAGSNVPANPANRWPHWPEFALLLGPAALAASAIASLQKNSRRRFALAVSGTAFCVALAVTGCGSVAGSGSSSTGVNAGTPTGTEAITITGTSGNIIVATPVPVTLR